MAGTTKTPKAGKGRPSDYTPELADEICAQLADGKSLRKICESKSMPNKATVFRWLRDHEDFSDQYARAKEESADALADDIQDISEGVLKKKYDPHAARVAIDGKKWIASKLKPKRYGDKLDITGEQTHNHKFRDLDDEQLDEAIKAVKDTIA